jgi:hypothetical protein
VYNNITEERARLREFSEREKEKNDDEDDDEENEAWF